MSHFASQITNGSLSGAAVVSPVGGLDCEIVGYIIKNATGNDNQEIELKEFGTSTIFQRIEIDDGESFIISTPFTADKGVTFDPVGNYAAGLTVTIFHKAIGSGGGKIAPRYSYKRLNAASGATLTVAGGGTVIVYGAYITNSGASQVSVVEMRDNDDNVITSWVPQRSTLSTLTVPWLADNGVKFVIDAVDPDISVTCFHSNPGV